MVGFRWERKIELAVTAAMLSTRDGGLGTTKTNTTALTVGKCIKLKGDLSGTKYIFNFKIHCKLVLQLISFFVPSSSACYDTPMILQCY